MNVRSPRCNLKSVAVVQCNSGASTGRRPHDVFLDSWKVGASQGYDLPLRHFPWPEASSLRRARALALGGEERDPDSAWNLDLTGHEAKAIRRPRSFLPQNTDYPNYESYAGKAIVPASPLCPEEAGTALQGIEKDVFNHLLALSIQAHRCSIQPLLLKAITQAFC